MNTKIETLIKKSLCLNSNSNKVLVSQKDNILTLETSNFMVKIPVNSNETFEGITSSDIIKSNSIDNIKFITRIEDTSKEYRHEFKTYSKKVVINPVNFKKLLLQKTQSNNANICNAVWFNYDNMYETNGHYIIAINNAYSENDYNFGIDKKIVELLKNCTEYLFVSYENNDTDYHKSQNTSIELNIDGILFHFNSVISICDFKSMIHNAMSFKSQILKEYKFDNLKEFTKLLASAKNDEKRIVLDFKKDKLTAYNIFRIAGTTNDYKKSEIGTCNSNYHSDDELNQIVIDSNYAKKIKDAIKNDAEILLKLEGDNRYGINKITIRNSNLTLIIMGVVNCNIIE
ncbi:MAG: hypothetical protein VZQ62_03785 [Methanosphaera sp.]|nr:hypothetical protein [Methanosphaera sp.]